MQKKSTRFFLEVEDLHGLLPTDHEPTLAIMGIRLNHDKLEKEITELQTQADLKNSESSK